MTENSKELVLLDMLLESILDGIPLTISGTPAVYNRDLPAHPWTVNIRYWTFVLLHDVRAKTNFYVAKPKIGFVQFGSRVK